MRISIERPIAGLGAAGARIDGEVRAVGIELAGKDALELQILAELYASSEFGFHFLERAFVIGFYCHLEEDLRVLELAVESLEFGDGAFKQGFFFVELLHLRRFFPDGRVLGGER